MSRMEKIRSYFGVQDMTEGNPLSKLAQFSVPLLIGNFAQQMYNTVDSIVVGQELGDDALAAVGTSMPIINLMLVLFMGIATGASILAAQYFGARDKETLGKVVGTTITLTFVSSIVVMALGYFTTPLLIGLMSPAADSGQSAAHFARAIAPGAVSYLQIIFLGILGGGMYNIFSGVLRGIGDSVNPLIYLVIASVVNVVLDIVMIRAMRSVAAVAWATIIAQFISGTLCLIRLMRMKHLFVISRQNLKPDRLLTRKLTALGLPSGITQGLFSMSAMVVQSLTNAIGGAMVAANVAIMRVDGFAMMPNFTYGTAGTTYVGQNIGAGKINRIRPGVSALLRLAVGTAAILVAAILLFGKNLIGLFTETEVTRALGARGLQWLSLGYIAFAVTNSLQGSMRGMGETRIPMWISIVTTILIRLPLAYFLAAITRSADWPNGSPDAILGSLLASWLISMVITTVIYRWGSWRKRVPGLQ